MIRYLTHNEIKKDLWDSCIANSTTSLPYAMSWWLDVVSPGWDGLVLDDYIAVMPLTWKNRLGLFYLRQPWLTQQLGIFSRSELNEEIVSLFISSLPEKFRYVDIQLNTGNPILTGNFELNFRANFILDLSPGYIHLESNYHRNCRRNIQKALHEGLHVKQGPGLTTFVRFIEKNLERSLSGNAGLYDSMTRITQISIERSYGILLGVYDRKEEMNAAGWFVKHSGRCFFLVCASTNTGKKNQAMHLLVDHMIREKAGKDIVFDFTGSNIPGVAYFNAGFGAVRQLYPAIKKNKLPALIRLFKK